MKKTVAVYVEVSTDEYYALEHKGYKEQHRVYFNDIDGRVVELAKFIIPVDA